MEEGQAGGRRQDRDGGMVPEDHSGMSALYVKQALAKRYACMVYTNSSAALPVCGGRTAFWEQRPCGGDGGFDNPDYLLDMAMTVTARGKIRWR